ncbi:MAG: hypothetical protein QXI07_09645 [Pyrobaculum sp.]
MIALLIFAGITAALIYVLLFRREHEDWRKWFGFALLYGLAALVSASSIAAPAGEKCTETCTTTAAGQECTRTCEAVYTTDYTSYIAFMMSLTMTITSFVIAAGLAYAELFLRRI